MCRPTAGATVVGTENGRLHITPAACTEYTVNDGDGDGKGRLVKDGGYTAGAAHSTVGSSSRLQQRRAVTGGSPKGHA